MSLLPLKKRSDRRREEKSRQFFATPNKNAKQTGTRDK
jgi:hypothetical protein